ncbi:deubiquitinase OTUD6B [Diaphorina citri]|uniref:Deubiquitinase OTUD6B n=1 Tax=Diaphorina citri TaxID=121845 RepID=A0A1S4EH55_DIACI|nr:deubiquitinase OTUD6B [Diaphorina citri]
MNPYSLLSGDKKEEAVETKPEEGGDDIQNVTDTLHGTKLGKPDKKEEAVETKPEEGGDDIQNVTDTLHGTKLGKAQRRREKKENEAREREARIKEQEKENVHGVRNKEIDAIKKILKQNKLMIHEIPSDGNW